MNYIVFDLEWNQALSKEKENKDIMFEILEIGAVKLNEKFEILDTFSSYIKPQVYLQLHHMTRQIVNFKLDDLKREKPFSFVMNNFLKWCGNNPLFCTWGISDLTELQRNMDYYNMQHLSEEPIKFYDVQKLYSLKFDDGKTRKALENAVSDLSINKKGQFHRALSDAYYTALIFSKIRDEYIFKFYSFDTYRIPKKKNELHITFPTYSKYISRSFWSKTHAMSDFEVSSVRCNICNSNTKRIIKWFTTNNGKFYLNIGSCKIHGFIKAKARIRKAPNNKVFVIKTVRTVSQELVNSIIDKYEKIKNKTYQKSKSSNSDL